MKLLRFIIPLALLIIQACTGQTDFSTEQGQVTSFIETASTHADPISEIPEDSIYFDGKNVVFFTPGPNELSQLELDKAAEEGMHQAVGDFAYYASLISDSMKSTQIPVHFTNRRHLVFEAELHKFTIDRTLTGSPFGLILYNGTEAPKVLPGMRTHLSLMSSISDYFYDHQPVLMPMLDYFEPVSSNTLHVYSSHSDILNQTGTRLDPSYYDKFGALVAKRAGKYRMSIYAYHKIALGDSLSAIICRVPSKYDESSIRLYIWDNTIEKVVSEIELAENVWNEKWIMVQDSWLYTTPDSEKFSITQRKKEARIKDGKRTVLDSLYRWQWTGSGFNTLSTKGLNLNDFPLQDWDSYQEPVKPTEFTIVDPDYAWLPLVTGDLTWENIILEFPKPFTIEKEPIPNQLVPNQVDTLITISRPQMNFRFYRSPERNIVIGGIITDSSLEFKKGIKVGMTKPAFALTFESIDGTAFPDLVKISSKQQDRIISYFFQNDLLIRIEFTNFIH